MKTQLSTPTSKLSDTYLLTSSPAAFKLNVY